jgi:P-type conjugative transfer protein TrbJ
MKRTLSLVVALGLCLAPGIARAQQTVYDPWTYSAQQVNNNQQIQQLMKAAQQVQQNINMLKNQAQQILMMKTQAVPLPASLLAQTQSDFYELQQIYAQMHTIAQSSATFDQGLHSMYPNYSPNMDLGAEFLTLDKNTQTAGQNAQAYMAATLQAAEPSQGYYYKQSKSNASLINQNQSTVGAIQVSSRMSQQVLEQLQKLQTLEAFRGQLEINYYMTSIATQNQEYQNNQQRNQDDVGIYAWAMQACPIKGATPQATAANCGITLPSSSTTSTQPAQNTVRQGAVEAPSFQRTPPR